MVPFTMHAAIWISILIRWTYIPEAWDILHPAMQAHPAVVRISIDRRMVHLHVASLAASIMVQSTGYSKIPLPFKMAVQHHVFTALHNFQSGTSRLNETAVAGAAVASHLLPSCGCDTSQQALGIVSWIGVPAGRLF